VGFGLFGQIQGLEVRLSERGNKASGCINVGNFLTAK